MSPSTSSRTVAGIPLPDSDLIRAALAHAKTNTDEMTFNHTYRSWVFGVLLATKMNISFNREIHAVSAILHDLAWDYTSPFSSNDKRFEVDGANAARDFLSTAAPTWDKQKVQLVWDSIALHTTASIARYKEPEVAVCNMGILADIVGDKFPGGLLPREEYLAVVEELPRHDLEAGIKRVLCNLCIHKPETTYDNVVRDFGTRFVEGYKPVQSVDMLFPDGI